jgi:hypothetical protein
VADASQRHLRDLPLAAADGRHLYTASDAILKGVLESEIPVVRLVAPPRPSPACCEGPPAMRRRSSTGTVANAFR